MVVTNDPVKSGENEVKTKLNEERLESDKKLGSAVSGTNQYSGVTTEALSLGLTLLNLDGSGNLMKLSQMLKTYSRFRFLDINHGPYLQNYFESTASNFDPPTKKSDFEILKKTKKFYRNMSKYRVPLDPMETNFVRVVTYFASWILKILCFFLLRKSLTSWRIGKFQCYLIAFIQKFHMVSINLAALDVLPFCQRALFQTQDTSFFLRATAAALLLLLTLDFTEIFYFGGKSPIYSFEPDRNQKIQRKISAHQETDIDSENRMSPANQKIFQEMPQISNETRSTKIDKLEEPIEELDERATILNLRQNLAITEFCTESAKEDKAFWGHRAVLMFNFSFLLKASFTQIVFVGLANYPQAALIILLSTETGFIAFIILVEVRLKHLKSILLLIPRVVQSLLIITLEAFFLVYFLRLDDKKQELPETAQLRIIKLILIANFVEYAIMILELFTIIRQIIAHRKGLKDPIYKQFIERT